MAFVIANIELVVVHCVSPFSHLKKETTAREGVTLFGWVATPNLAVSQKIIPKTTQASVISIARFLTVALLSIAKLPLG
jgi:hypothetical protein